MADNPLPDLFETFQREAFRVESLPEYRIEGNGEYAQFQSYLDGGLQPDPSINAEWYESVSAWRGIGKSIVRVRVIPEHPSPYVDFEIDWFYPHSVSAGEDIFVISEALFRSELSLPLHDFWIFDSSQVGIMEYAPDGSFLCGANPKYPIQEYLNVQAKLLGLSTPLRLYLSRKRRGLVAI